MVDCIFLDLGDFIDMLLDAMNNIICAYFNQYFFVIYCCQKFISFVYTIIYEHLLCVGP